MSHNILFLSISWLSLVLSGRFTHPMPLFSKKDIAISITITIETYCNFFMFTKNDLVLKLSGMLHLIVQHLQGTFGVEIVVV